MIPYIVLVGSASTGKSSTVQHLLPHLTKLYSQPVYYIAEVARKLNQNFGVLINKEGTSDTQRMIETAYTKEEEVHLNEIKIADRSIIDRYAYTITSNASQDIGLIQWYRENIQKVCSKYSHIFYLPISDNVPLSLDGVRSPDKQFREEVDKIIAETIKEYKIPVYILNGTLKERANQALKVLNEKEK